MLRHARNKVNARRFDARMPENIRQLDDILVCAIKCRREQVAQIVRENFPCVDARADAQLFHFRPNLISRHGLAAFGAKDRAGGGFCRAANLSSLRQSFDGSRIVRILPLSAISVLPFFAASTVIYCTSLTRMLVEQMVSIRSARLRSPVASAAATNLSYSPRVSSCLLSRNRRRWILRNRARQSVQPQKQKKPFSAAKQALMVDGA